MGRLLLAAALVAGAACLGTANDHPSLVPSVVKLTGRLDPAPEERSNFHDLVLDVHGTRFILRDTSVTVLRGDLIGGDVIDDASRYTPSFRLVGPKDTLAKLDATPPGSQVAITGVWRRGDRAFTVSDVQFGKPA